MSRLFALPFLVVVAGCALQPVTTNQPKTTSQPVSTDSFVRYECYTYVGSNHVLTLPIPGADADDPVVDVTFHGDPIGAVYVRRGLTQVWLFEEQIYLELDPDYSAAYYDFTGAEEGERRSPESVFQCERHGGDESAGLQATDSGEAGLLDQYARLIEDRIERNWIRPANAGPGLRCEVNVTQIPSGDVVDVRVSQCNGDETVIRSIEAAVLRASPLPQPPIPSLFSRNLIVTFQPDD